MAERVVLLDSINPAAEQVFESAGLEVVKFPKSMPAHELAELVEDAHILGVRSGPQVPAEILEAGDTLGAVGCFSVGTSHVDIDVATENAIAVFNSNYENTRSVAEHVISSVFVLMKRISEHNMSLHDGTWTKSDKQSYEVRGKTLGVVGYGAIGSQVSVLAEANGMSVIYYDPQPKFPSYGNAKRMRDMDAFLAQSDVVTLHVPGGTRTRHMINENTLQKMKPGSYLINTARGEVVDYEAVDAALQSGQLAGVASDVFLDEPSNQGDPFDHILRGNKRALLTPHVAGSTQEAQYEIGGITAAKLLGYLATGNSADSVNLPELPVGAVAGGNTRILHFHHNVPGVAADMARIIAEAGLNINAQELRVRGDVGYAAIDVAAAVPDDVSSRISAYEHTIRYRILEGRQ